ncbi:MAG: o-succinylbenzoate--CoA ligase, partial [Dehalococcoidia bacterium]
MAGPLHLTFAELDRRVDAVARPLSALGLGSGGRLAVLMGNNVEFVELVHAVARVGATLVPLSARLAAGELRWQLEDAGVGALVYDEPNRAAAEVASGSLAGLRALPAGELGAGAPAPPLSAGGELLRIDLSAVHTIVYTAGTAGRPKGAMLTYGNHFWSAVGSALNLGLHGDDRWLACLPLFHVGGLAILMRSVIYGVPALLHDGFDPLAVNRAIDDEGVTTVSLVSNMLQRLLEARGERPWPPGLRCVLVGGGPVPRPLLEECARRGVPALQTYGMTEAASQVATLAPEDAQRKLGSAGRPLLPTELRIEGEDGGALPPGEPGEIVVRGPVVTPGYFNRPEETRRMLRDGWLHTGDIGYLDREGYLYVLDRRDDLIVSGGENVYPVEVEGTLEAHPAVREAGVVGLADERWGQTVAATVALRAGETVGEEELLAFCNG